MELEERKEYLDTKKIDTIYFGGGTPSVLSIKDWERIFQKLSEIYEWKKNAEITVECNPDDINTKYLQDLKRFGVNRISLGVQSLSDEVLKWMGRKHSVLQSKESIRCIQKAGIENFSVDIIFGIPDYSKENLIKDILSLINDFNPPHISVYQLTIEPKTKLNYLVKTKKIIPSDDEKIRSEFLEIQEILTKKSYVHYEVSNYAKSGYESKHNSAYWLQKKYIGIGPSAHSYNGAERQWNVANNYRYANGVLRRNIFFEKEILNANQKFNEYVYTRLRTIYGCNVNEIRSLFGEEYEKHFLKVYNQNKTYFDVQGDIYSLNPKEGYLFSDKISLDFFI